MEHNFVTVSGMSQAAIAKAAGVHPVLIHQWSTGKRPLPADRVLAVSRATAWLVTPHALRPDIYPNPTDGLPPEVVEKSQDPVQALADASFERHLRVVEAKEGA